MSPYQIQVLAFVHAIRVEPEVEIHRLVLADYLEEYSKRVGVESRTIKYLRDGKMVCNTLDIQAMYLYIDTMAKYNRLAITSKEDTSTTITKEYNTISDMLIDVRTIKAWVSIEDYKTLWNAVIGIRNVVIEGPEFAGVEIVYYTDAITEAEAIARDRLSIISPIINVSA